MKKGAKFGVADDFPKEVDEVRKALQPVRKNALQARKKAFFNVQKLIIDGEIYRAEKKTIFILWKTLGKRW